RSVSECPGRVLATKPDLDADVALLELLDRASVAAVAGDQNDLPIPRFGGLQQGRDDVVVTVDANADGVEVMAFPPLLVTGREMPVAEHDPPLADAAPGKRIPEVEEIETNGRVGCAG